MEDTHEALLMALKLYLVRVLILIVMEDTHEE